MSEMLRYSAWSFFWVLLCWVMFVVTSCLSQLVTVGHVGDPTRVALEFLLLISPVFVAVVVIGVVGVTVEKLR